MQISGNFTTFGGGLSLQAPEPSGLILTGTVGPLSSILGSGSTYVQAGKIDTFVSGSDTVHNFARVSDNDTLLFATSASQVVGNVITSGPTSSINAVGVSDEFAVCQLTDSTYLFSYLTNSDERVRSSVVTYDSNTNSMTFGPIALVASGETKFNPCSVALDNSRVLTVWTTFPSNFLEGVVQTVSGSTFTQGTITTTTSNNYWAYTTGVLLDTDKVLFVGQSVSGTLNAVVATVSGTSVSFGTELRLPASSDLNRLGELVKVSETKVIQFGGTNDQEKLQARVFNVSGSTVTSSTLSEVADAGIQDLSALGMPSVVDLGGNQYYVVYAREKGAGEVVGRTATLDTNTDAITFGPAVQLQPTSSIAEQGISASVVGAGVYVTHTDLFTVDGVQAYIVE